jgi:hypothetical membrane protein
MEARGGSGIGSDRGTIAGALAWILLVWWFVGQAIAQSAWTAPYSWRNNFISDLAAERCGRLAFPFVGYDQFVCSPWRGVMDATFVSTGLLILSGLFLIRGLWPQGRLATVGRVLVLVTGGGYVLLGFAPEDTQWAMHVLGVLSLACSPIAMLLFGLAIRTERPRIAAASLILATVTVTGFGLGRFVGLGFGGAERLGSYPFEIWAITIGQVVLVNVMRRGQGTPTPAPEPVETFQRLPSA